MVTKQTLSNFSVSVIEEYFELINDNIYNGDQDLAISMFKKMSIHQMANFFRYIADTYYEGDINLYPMRELKSILLSDEED
jgi:hypothetical protein